jgi:adenosine/AMP deaminase-like protein
VLADLHLHLYGCIRPPDLLRHLAASDQIRWDSYEQSMRTAYGTVPPTREIVERYRQGDPEAEALFAELFVFGDADAGDFDRFQAKFNLLGAGSALGDKNAMPAKVVAEVEAFTRAIRAGHARDGIDYAETRVLLGPTLAGPRDRAVIDTLLAGYDVPGAATTERLALSLSRKDPWAAWDRVRELALGPHGAAVTAVDFCFVEEGFPPKDKADFFAAVREFNDEHPDRALAILYHVGESFRDKSLESSVRWVHEAAELGANRLGHAIALGIDPAVFGPHTRTEPVGERRDQIAYDLAHADGLAAAGVKVDQAALRAELDRLPRKGTVPITYDDARLDEVRRRQDYAMSRIRYTAAVVEVCPTSNRRIGGITDPSHHPVHRFLAANLNVVVASDDPGIFGTTLHDELDWVCQQTGGGTELRRHLMSTAWHSRSEVLTGRASVR